MSNRIVSYAQDTTVYSLVSGDGPLRIELQQMLGENTNVPIVLGSAELGDYDEDDYIRSIPQHPFYSNPVFFQEKEMYSLGCFPYYSGGNLVINKKVFPRPPVSWDTRTCRPRYISGDGEVFYDMSGSNWAVWAPTGQLLSYGEMMDLYDEDYPDRNLDGRDGGLIFGNYFYARAQAEGKSLGSNFIVFNWNEKVYIDEIESGVDYEYTHFQYVYDPSYNVALGSDYSEKVFLVNVYSGTSVLVDSQDAITGLSWRIQDGTLYTHGMEVEPGAS